MNHLIANASSRTRETEEDFPSRQSVEKLIETENIVAHEENLSQARQCCQGFQNGRQLVLPHKNDDQVKLIVRLYLLDDFNPRRLLLAGDFIEQNQTILLDPIMSFSPR